MRLRNVVRIAPAIILAVALSACSGDGGDKKSPSGASSAATSNPSSTASTLQPTCDASEVVKIASDHTPPQYRVLQGAFSQGEWTFQRIDAGAIVITTQPTPNTYRLDVQVQPGYKLVGIATRTGVAGWTCTNPGPVSLSDQGSRLELIAVTQTSS